MPKQKGKRIKPLIKENTMTETNEKVEPKPIDLGEYKYGFHDDVTPVFSTGKGISEDVVRAMSAEKGEPEWMLEFRLKSLETFKKMPMQEWGPDLSEIDFDDLTYFQKASDRPARDWEDVPEKIKETFLDACAQSVYIPRYKFHVLILHISVCIKIIFKKYSSYKNEIM